MYHSINLPSISPTMGKVSKSRATSKLVMGRHEDKLNRSILVWELIGWHLAEILRSCHSKMTDRPVYRNPGLASASRIFNSTLFSHLQKFFDKFGDEAFKVDPVYYKGARKSELKTVSLFQIAG